jgi:hypothetical protein
MTMAREMHDAETMPPLQARDTTAPPPLQARQTTSTATATATAVLVPPVRSTAATLEHALQYRAPAAASGSSPARGYPYEYAFQAAAGGPGVTVTTQMANSPARPVSGRVGAGQPPVVSAAAKEVCTMFPDVDVALVESMVQLHGGNAARAVTDLLDMQQAEAAQRKAKTAQQQQQQPIADDWQIGWLVVCVFTFRSSWLFTTGKNT